MTTERQAAFQLLDNAEPKLRELNKARYETSVDIAMPIGQSNQLIDTHVDVLVEIDHTKKVAFMRVDEYPVNRRSRKTTETYYTADTKFIKEGEQWKKEKISLGDFDKLFGSEGLSKILNSNFCKKEDFSLAEPSRENVQRLNSTAPLENLANATLDAVNVYGNFSHQLERNSLNIDIDQQTGEVTQLEIDAGGVLGQTGAEQRYEEKAVVKITPLPDEFEVELPRRVG